MPERPHNAAEKLAVETTRSPARGRCGDYATPTSSSIAFSRHAALKVIKKIWDATATAFDG